MPQVRAPLLGANLGYACPTPELIVTKGISPCVLSLQRAWGSALALITLLREGPGPAIWIDVVVGGSGMFAFLVMAGAYVRLVGADRPAAGMRRRIIDAAVVGCAAVPVELAFREWLWWIVGPADGDAGRLGELLLIVGVVTAGIVFASEAIFRVHRTGAA